LSDALDKLANLIAHAPVMHHRLLFGLFMADFLPIAQSAADSSGEDSKSRSQREPGSPDVSCRETGVLLLRAARRAAVDL
jgi:hypothetical protein